MKTLLGKELGARDRILHAAAELFHKQGIHSTSPDEIIEASGTGKGQFYYYFRSKGGLIHEVLQASLQALRSGRAPVSYEVNSWDDLERCFMGHIALQKKFNMTRGCPIGTVGNELDEKDELIRQDVGLIFEVMRNRLATFFVKEKAQGRLREEADEDRLASFCIATIQGALLIGKITRNSQPVEAAFQEALWHLKQYVRHDMERAKAG
jgi:TetR/AcrR family transcriptional repressor of nem operon